MIPTGDTELKKITITLFINEWESGINMAAGALKTHGITTETVKNMILNACAVYKC